jgi:enediyne biosynthesis protein E2
MPTTLGSLRRLVMTPSLTEVTFAKRGFPVTQSPVTERLEKIPQMVICGFEWGIDARDQWEIERRLGLVDTELLGFAFEGVTMAFAILDAMGPRRKNHTRGLLTGPGGPHIFLAYIGIGFAMSHLPRRLWSKVMPDLTGSPYYPTMSWLAVDGYGFDLAYFHTARWVERQEVPRPYPWEGSPDYFLRAVDQGIGRALWFIHAADAAAVAAAVGRFADHRQPDLWSGVGLAATFAGGATQDGLAALRHASGQYHAELAQGSVFAAKARAFAGLVPAHTELATMVLAGLPVESASTLADRSAVADADPAGPPAYELWRQKVRDHFLSFPQGASPAEPQSLTIPE